MATKGQIGPSTKTTEEQDIDTSSVESWDSSEDRESNAQISAAKCLYIGSKHFNPILSLGCKDTAVPVPEAPRYHSIEEFAECVPNLEVEGTPPPKFRVSRKQRKVMSRLPLTDSPTAPAPSVTHQVPSAKVENTSDTNPIQTSTVTADAAFSGKVPGQFYPIPGRRFLPHQLPVARIEKKKPNVLTLMDECKGPLAALNEARLKVKRVRVWRRDHAGIRGYCTGFVIGFDKHWNLILKDVDEIFQRRREKPEVKNTVPEIQPRPSTSASRSSIRSHIQKLINEKSSFKSGQFLSEYSKEVKSNKTEGSSGLVQPCSPHLVRKGTPTGFLINGPEDAIEVCRIGIRSLMIQGIQTQKSVGENTQPRETLPSNVQPPVSKSTLRKKQLVILRDAQMDFLGNKIVARTQLYEIVERHLAQIVLMGRCIAFVETNL